MTNQFAQAVDSHFKRFMCQITVGVRPQGVRKLLLGHIGSAKGDQGFEQGERLLLHLA